MDFAPYQSSPPEATRSPTASPRTSLDARRAAAHSPAGSNLYQARQSNLSPPPLQHPQPQRAWSGEGFQSRYYQQSPLSGYQNSGGSSPDYYAGGNGGAGGGGWGNGRVGEYFSSLTGQLGGLGLGQREGVVSEFDTSLGLRLDYEACLAYLVFPPIGGILLLILERKSDYVRFHAWQSSLLFTALFVVHLLFSWSTFLSWLFFLGDLVLIGWLVLNSYRDADTLDRYEVPIVGRIASRILDDE
ncbi:hypothetical protein VTJ04DRAFT_4968 [Mycothermus thermophilus]|uniref:uncharacterized protein n=1 Tax=Humicola insolens TaxID=85995 RepID=UPI0037423E18